ncbi:tape measure protein [Microbacterium oxydans]|uniref:tape measure protein n=1 Tax=Microbacterium oxydans TaxID=82380 RepID=UPI0011448829|nr:tape measure protein [Microbacterium oxydans]KAB1891054.1 tape measure protein [Microbacterium oxydans]GED39084.1 hypothetical protein MOX01_22260 [Microbacterium oxydans]
MAEAVLFVELVPTTSGMKRGIEKDLNGTFDQAEKRGSSVFSKIGGLAKGAALAAAGAAAVLTGIAVKGGFDRMLKIEDAQAKLEGLGHSVSVVDQIMSSALAAVKGTAFGLDTAATVAASAVAAGIKPGQELEKYLRLTADAATIAGISMDEMGSIMNKVQASGRAMTENLNQLQDRGIPILQWLAEEYGVTAAEMSKMVSQGKVDAETFNRVLQENIGGAALKSGETTRGAWANMLAAMSRVGVALLENVFPYFKQTFNGITEFLDDLTSRIGPFAAIASEKFAVVGGAIKGLYDLLIRGDFTSLMSDVFGWEEDSPIVDFLLSAREAVLALGPEIMSLAGYFTPLGAVLNVLVPLLPLLLPPMLELARVVSDFASVILPVFVEFLSQAATVIAGALVAALPVLASALSAVAGVLSGVVGWLSDVSGILGPLAVSVLAGAATFKVWQGAIVAWSAITKAAAGVQLAFNAVMSANPIMLIVTAIAALVGGLVWFFTQTELGQEIWANFTGAIGAAATWLWESVLQPVFNAIGEIFSWIYEQIIMPVVTGIMLYIGLWAAIAQWLWETVLSPVFNAIGQIFTWIYENVIVPIIDGIIVYFQAWGAIFTWLYETIIQPVFAAIGAAFVWIYENIIAPVGAAIAGAIQFIGDTIHAVFSGIADFVGSAFQAVLSVVRGPVNALIGLINGIIDGLNSISVDIPDWVPMVGGQTFGLNIPKIPQLEDGALVKARTGGIIANIGEGRYDEVVLPLSPEVLSRVGGGRGGGDINVYPQPGQSEEEIGRAAARYQAQAARRFG